MWFRLRHETPLLLAALVIAFVIWLIAMQGGRDSNWVTVPVQLTSVPDNLEVELAPSQRGGSVSVNVLYPKEQRGRIVEKNFAVAVPVGDIISNDPAQWSQPTAAKTVRYNLSVNNVQIFGLPEDIEVIRVQPDVIELDAKLRTLALEVDVPTTGTLPAQYQLTDRLMPEPARVLVTGSQDALDALAQAGRKVQTQPVDLATISQSGQIPRDLVLPKSLGVQLVNPRNTHVSVNVGLQERAVSKVFKGVPVSLTVLSPTLRARITPPTVDVTVEGPPSALNQISNDSFVFSTGGKALEERTGRPQEVGVEVSFRARVAQALTQRLKITAVQPPRISVEFVPANAQDGTTSPSLGLPTD